MSEFNSPKEIVSRLLFLVYGASALAWLPLLIMALAGVPYTILYFILNAAIFISLYLMRDKLSFGEHHKTMNQLYMSDEEIAEENEKERKKQEWEDLREQHRIAREE
jgi:flagellar biosynthesis component FlhA